MPCLVILLSSGLVTGILLANAKATVSFQHTKFDLVVIRNLEFSELRFKFFLRQHFAPQILFFEMTILDEL